MAEPESLVTVTSDGFDGRSPTGPAIQIDLDDLDRRWQPRLPDLGPAEPVEIVVVGHFDDRRSFACPPAVQDECRDRFVVDRVDWVDRATQPSSVVGADDGRQTSTPAAVQAIVAEATPGDSLLSMAVVDGPTGIGRIEPSLGTGRGGFIDQAWVWVVRVLEGERSVTYLVVDGTDAIFEMDGEGVPIQVGGSPLSTPAPSPGAFATFRFDLVAPEGPVVRMVLSDASRRLIDARSATLDELGRPGPDTALGRLGVDELGPGILLVRWGGVVCDTALELVVEMSAPIHLRLRGVHPPCDAMGIGRGVVLTFADDLDPARVTTEDLRQAVAPLPTTVAGLGITDIETALKLMTEPGNDRELAVAGWYWRDPTLQCLVLDVPPPLLDPGYPGCPDDHDRLLEAPDAGLADTATFRPVLGTWLREALPRDWRATPVILIGHFDDRRATACTAERRTACADGFLVDAIWADGRLQGRDWTMSAADEPKPVGTHERAAGLASGYSPASIPLSVGVISGSALGTIEPVMSSDSLTRETWVWHVIVLDGRRVRAFLLPDSAMRASALGANVTIYEIVGEEVVAPTIID